MGVYLTKPSTEKMSAEAASSRMEYGASSMQGWRTAQEDAHCCHLDVDCRDISIFGVFDGHGGVDVSRYCADRLLSVLMELDSFKNGDYETALYEAFLELDKLLLNEDVKQQLISNRAKQDSNAADENGPKEESDLSDASGDDLDQLKADAQLSVNDLIAKMVKPKKDSPFLRKKSEKGGGSSSEMNGAGSSSSESPVSSGACRKRTFDYGKQLTKPENTLDNTEKEACTSSKSDCEVKESIAAVGSPTEPDHKRALVDNEPDENLDAIKNNECKNGDHPEKCPDAPLTDCKQKLNNATATKKETEECITVKSDVADKEKDDKIIEEKEVDEGESVEGESSDETDDEDDSDDDDRIYREMMEDELKNLDSSEDNEEGDDDDDDDDDEDVSSRKARYKKFKALGLLGGATLRRSILAATQAGIIEDSEDSGDEEDDEYDSDEQEQELGSLKVKGGPDIEFLSPPDERMPGVGSGATAVVALCKGNNLYVANAGDSRCIIYKNGETVPMSFDHKPEDQVEIERITKAGGRVTPDGRVMGGLNLSRAIGDHLYKRCKELPLEEQMVTSKPDLKSLDLSGVEFMVLACDGIWNSMTNEEVASFVKERIDTMPLTKICAEIFDHCLAPSTAGDGTGCDNMTAIIVKFFKEDGKPAQAEIGSACKEAPVNQA